VGPIERVNPPASSGHAVPAAWRRGLPLVAWMAAIYLVSAQPDLPHAPDGTLDWILKKGLHATAYGILAWLWWRALEGALADGEARWRWSLLLTVAYAAADEWHQAHVPGRHGQPLDVLIDARGAAVVLGLLARRRRQVAAGPRATLPQARSPDSR
jgi:VanZ family protein